MITFLYPYTIVTESPITIKPTPKEVFDENWANRNELLTPRELDMLEMRYKHKNTLQEIGNKHGLCRDRVRQIIIKATRKLVCKYPSQGKGKIFFDETKESL